MFWQILHIVEIIIWVLLAVSVLYVAFFAFISLFTKRSSLNTKNSSPNTKPNSFLILFPAYNEDKVIINSVKACLQQTYDKALYDVVVISDHMTAETNATLGNMPVTLLQPIFEKSSKAKAMQYAINSIQKEYDKVVILDADNIVAPDFLEQLNIICQQGYNAIQCHRCAKNNNNDIAALDGVSEEINNTIFRKAHNTIGLSSALIGSGMCFDFKWFSENVHNLTTAGEDRELEALLMKQNIFIKYTEHIHVLDEKVSNSDNFQRQRLRWMTAQIQSLLSMLPYIPQAIMKGNINYIDKTFQQAMVPRSISIVIIFIMAFLILIINPLWSLKWWILFAVLIISLTIATPPKLRNISIFSNPILLCRLTFKMISNVKRIEKNNKEFLHTNHG